MYDSYLHCAQAVAQCIVIGLVWFVCVCGSVTMITRNCMHRSSPKWVCGFDHLQLIKFWPSRAPRKGSAAGRNFLAPPYYIQRALFASPLSTFFISSSLHGYQYRCRKVKFKLAKFKIYENHSNNHRLWQI